MHNVLSAECMKLRRNGLFLVCTLIDVLLPLIMVIQEVIDYGGAIPEDRPITWVYRLSMLFLLIVYPVLSGFVLTFMLQKEYGDHTMITTLTAPIGRIRFLMGKVLIWAVWHMAVTLLYLLIMGTGVRVLYGSALFSQSLPEISGFIIKLGLFHLFTFTPAIWAAVLQRKAFYPSLLCGLIFAGIGFSGLYWPKLPGSVVPWAAAVRLCFDGVVVIPALAYASIGICAILGLGMAIYSFKRQQL